MVTTVAANLSQRNVIAIDFLLNTWQPIDWVGLAKGNIKEEAIAIVYDRLFAYPVCSTQVGHFPCEFDLTWPSSPSAVPDVAYGLSGSIALYVYPYGRLSNPHISSRVLH